MNKNIKRMFFVLTLITLLATVGAVCATENADSTTATSSSVSDVTTVSDTASDTIAELATTTSKDNKVDTKTIEKEEKNLKTTSKTIEVSDTTSLHNAIQEISTDNENDEYVIDLNEGNYLIPNDGETGQFIKNASNVKNVIINGNNQTISGNYYQIMFRTNYNITLNNIRFNQLSLLNYNNLTINNCICGGIVNDGILTLDNNTNLTTISGSGNIYTEDFSRIVPYLSQFNGTYTVENVTFTKGEITNYGNLTLYNCKINNNLRNYYGNLTLYNCTVNKLNNYGNLIVDDESIISGDYQQHIGATINDISRVLNALSLIEGNFTFENMDFIGEIDRTFNGNYTFINCNFTTSNKYMSFNYDKWGNTINLINCNLDSYSTAGSTLNFTNSTLSKEMSIYSCRFIIDNDSNINSYINNYGTVIIDDFSKIFNWLSHITGEHTLVNFTFNVTKDNYGILTIINSTIEKALNNEGKLIIDENTVIYPDVILNGDIESTNMERLIPYLNYVEGNYNIENMSFNHEVTFDGGFIFHNVTFNNPITIYGEAILDNCIINCDINNYGKLTIYDNNTFLETASINGYGELICDDIQQILPYLSTINGNYTIENITFKEVNFNGNIILNNCTLTNRTVNNGNLTLNHSTMNIVSINQYLSTLLNNGNLTISDDTILLNGTISGNGNVYTNHTDILDYLTSLTTDYTFRNINFTNNVSNYANLVLINCNLSSKIDNYGNLTIINSSLSNNNISSPMQGWLISNRANATLNNCVMSNNTCEIYDYNDISPILNSGTLTLINSNFTDNKIGSQIVQNYNYKVVNGLGGITRSYIGNIIIDNCIFNNNYAGSRGGCIYAENTNITINNSCFNNNSVSGYCAEAIYAINEQLNIENTIFDNHTLEALNGEQEGTVIYASNVNLTNCTFKNNQMMGSGGWGDTNYAGIIYAVNLNMTNSNYQNNSGGVYGSIYTIIDGYFANNTFQNNDKGSRIIYSQNSIIKNNQFINNQNAICVYSLGTINNNTFINTGNPITSESNEQITNNTYQNVSLSDTLILNVPNKTYEGETIIITGNYTIIAPQSYDENILEQNKFQIYINGVLNQTIDDLEFNITPTAGNMIVTVKPTISTTKATEVLKSTTLSYLTITPENYDTYIYEGTLLGIGKDTKITFKGNFENKDEIILDANDILIDGENATFTNTRFILDAENITIQNMKINNMETSYPIVNYQNNNIITNNTITLTNTNIIAAAIYNHASHTEISNNILNVEVPAEDIDFSSGAGVAPSQAILLLGGDQNIVQNNTIRIKSSSSTGYGTLEAVTNSNNATNTLITKNIIKIQDSYFNYAIDCLNDVNNITITENNITVIGERYCDGIQVGNNANNILIENNNITCICQNETILNNEGAITYGVIATSMGSSESNNITITNNNINITGTANYAIELYKVNATEIHNNNITVNGPYSMGIAYAYAPNGNATQNTITINGDSTTGTNAITEEIQPENTGIKIQNGTQNINIENNIITTNDKGGQDSTIHSDEENVTIRDNQLISSEGYGDETIIAPETATIENNIVETTTTLAVPETIIINTPVTLTATVTIADDTPINGGIVTFTIGNELIAQATVTDGIATATHTFTQEEYVTIVASYTPESSGLSTSSDEATTNIQDPITQLNIEEVDMTAGKTVTLTATVTDQNGNNINDGKVTFKVNGKTVKDANGKVVYAKVVDGVATVNYTVADNLAGKDVEITAVYSGYKEYESAKTNTTVTVNPKELTLTATATTTQLTATLSDNTINTGKIVFKINGKTVKDSNGKVIYAKVTNGTVIVDYILPESYKAGNYTVTATFIASGYDKLVAETTLTVAN